MTEEDDRRFRWRWFDWAACIVFSLFGVAICAVTRDWLAGMVMIFVYPVIRAIAVGQSR